MSQTGDEYQWVFMCPYHGKEECAFCFRAFDESLLDNWKLLRRTIEELNTTPDQRLKQMLKMKG